MWCWVRNALLLLVLVAAPGLHAADTLTLRLTTPDGEVVLTAEIADDPAERARGLMFREDFGPGDAMLFIFEEERQASFWMKNTPVSLDILYFDAAGRWLNSHHHTVPYSDESLRSAGPALYVLEIAAGEAKKLGLGKGTMLVLPPGEN
ncbi:MAG: DUF192 domain-containing protein [Candidatus Puniceispirillales bacterium]